MSRDTKGLRIFIPAAGSSSRMGGLDKLVEDAGGVPLLRRVAIQACETGLPVIVALAETRGDRAAVLGDLPIERLVVPDAASGLSAAFRTLAGQLRPSPTCVLPADMPDIRTSDIKMVADAFQEHEGKLATRGATQDGLAAGHPVILPIDLVEKFPDLSGDQGAAPLLRGAEVRLVPLPGRRAVTDLDTPQDWERWRAASGQRQ